LDIREDFKLSTVLEETIVGSAKFGALAATFLGGAMMKRYGRRITIAADSILFFAGPLMMAFAGGPG
jgi:MFS family permease